MSPTRLAATASKGTLRALMEQRAVQVARAGPPWTGFVQDSTGSLVFANSELYGPSATGVTTNLICRNEALTWDYGWKRMQGATGAAALPLGGATTAFPLTAVTAACNTIGALAYLPSIAATTTAGGSVESNVAITTYLAANGNGGPYYLNIAAGDWAGATPSGGAAGVTTDETRRIDWTVYSLANSPSVAARQATLIFCNGVGTGGKVWYYPSNRDGTTYTYFPLTTTAPYPNLTNFMAESVCTAAERVIFLGTSENGTSYPQRVRWTAQSWTDLTSATQVWNNIVDGGAGGLDLVEFGGRGLRILPQGDRIVCYFSDGVAVLNPTGRTVPAFTRGYVTKTRGLLGKGTVVDIGGGVHFGIFTDGFWFFTEGGEWKEAGLGTFNDARARKWGEYFFDALNRVQADRITMGYDPERKLVYISFPSSTAGTGTPALTWVYELGADRVWPQIYTLSGGGGGTVQYGYAWGYLRSTEGPSTVKMALTHGSGNGFVWEHVPNLTTRDATSVTWIYRTPCSDYGDPYSLKTLLADRIDYANYATAGTLSTYKLYDGRNLSTSMFSYTSGVAYPAITSERSTLLIPVHATALSIQHEIVGTHPFTIFGLQHEFVKNGDAL